MRISVHIESWPLKSTFRITGVEWTATRGIVVQLEKNGHVGRGEAQGIYYLDETADVLFSQVEAITEEIRRGISREELQQVMPPGGARNAIDCAMWDLECKIAKKSIWELTGIEPRPVTTVFTIGLEDSAAAMAAKAAAAKTFPNLKIKLDGHQVYEKLAAIRAARPDARLVVDANQGWDFDLLQSVISKCVPLELDMIEQPLPRGKDQALEGFESSITLAADESCLHTGELDTAARRYSMINIKLDKTGGLTEAFRLATEARERGLKLMVGNMMGTSLGMAPAFVIAQLCDFVDIDGPLFLKYDQVLGLEYDQGIVAPPSAKLWG